MDAIFSRKTAFRSLLLEWVPESDKVAKILIFCFLTELFNLDKSKGSYSRAFQGSV